MSTLAKTTRRFAAREQRVYNSARAPMTSYMPASILNIELGHARELHTTELHTHAESGEKTLFPNAELNLLSPGSGCKLQAGTGHGRQDGLRADADVW